MLTLYKTIKSATGGYGDGQTRSWSLKANIADQEAKKDFYEQLQSVLENIIIVVGDLNAKVGSASPIWPERWSLEKKVPAPSTRMENFSYNSACT